MREINFRVFDLLDKKMLSWGDVMHLPAWEIFSGTPEQRPFEVMQYIGLKDRSGKEIYEGDIVKVLGLTPFIAEAPISLRGVVQWIDHDARFMIVDKENEQLYGFEVGTSPVVVIGNIYENPELIEEKKCTP